MVFNNLASIKYQFYAHDFDIKPLANMLIMPDCWFKNLLPLDKPTQLRTSEIIKSYRQYTAICFTDTYVSDPHQTIMVTLTFTQNDS